MEHRRNHYSYILNLKVYYGKVHNPNKRNTSAHVFILPAFNEDQADDGDDDESNKSHDIGDDDSSLTPHA